ncbi:hypothetical protein [Streptomyces sp. Ru62]|uniref:hypothetical protein n=1 Tax=Streptomyces sp. Ru62 TaxID=2080745 RepID=UPI0021566A1A|nr:hypothetical protein [Streptomyces sp. Ru62]
MTDAMHIVLDDTAMAAAGQGNVLASRLIHRAHGPPASPATASRRLRSRSVRAGRARAQQDSLWNRQQLANQLRSLLREYYPAALDAFATWTNGLCRPEARELLKAASTPTRAARLTRTQLQAVLKRAGRKRGVEAEADRLRDAFRAEWAHQPPLIEDSLGRRQVRGLLVGQQARDGLDDVAHVLAAAEMAG